MEYKSNVIKHSLFTFIILVILFLNCSHSVCETVNSGFIHVEHRDLYDANENLVKLRGFNLGGWLLWEPWIWSMYSNPQESVLMKNMSDILGSNVEESFVQKIYRNFISKKDFEVISGAGFNCVRIPFNHRFFDNEGLTNTTFNGWEFMDTVLGWCKAYNIYAVLDMHSTPGGQSKERHADINVDSTLWLWSSEKSKLQTIELWKNIANHFKNNEMIAGYDLINEPLALNSGELFNFYKRIINGIREVDKNHIIFLEGNNVGTDFSAFKKLPGENVALSCHVYTGLTVSSYDIEKIAKNYESISANLDLPVWVGEWGENSFDNIKKTVYVFENKVNVCGWTLWTWKRTRIENKTVPYTFSINEGWKIIVDRLEGRLQKFPDNFDVNAALDQFFTQFKPENCIYDDELMKALSNFK
jgi:endoglucanase